MKLSLLPGQLVVFRLFFSGQSVPLQGTVGCGERKMHNNITTYTTVVRTTNDASPQPGSLWEGAVCTSRELAGWVLVIHVALPPMVCAVGGGEDAA